MKKILITPLVSEKSMALTPDGKYIFVVAKNANKQEISHSIEKLYDVKVIAVNTINNKGKKRYWRGRSSGMTKNWKKAIITIAKGQKIAEFEVKNR